MPEGREVYLMKKGLSVLLVLVLCMSLAAAVGCSGGGGNGTEDDFLIGAIYINGQNDTAGYLSLIHI